MEEEFVGDVIWFANKLNYGFISRKDEKDLFVHFSDIECDGFKSLKKGQRVKFTIGKNNSGNPKACHVVVLAEW